MKKEYSFNSIQSGRVTVILDNDKMTIKRKGLFSFIAHGLKGEKTIMLNQINAIQMKEVGMTVGYLQFILTGSQESKRGLQGAMKDENTVAFDSGGSRKKINNEAREIKTYIEEFNSKRLSNNFSKQDDQYDKLSKLKKLLDANAITEEEYKKEKEKLLSTI